MSGQNIRSSVHRQVLLHLRRRAATVSQLALALNLRMPHASLACKQLKLQGWVHRDESSGLRNAPFSLTHEGLARLEADALAKIGVQFNDVPRQQTGVVLQSEGEDVLIGYLEPPDSAFVFIPERADWVDDGSTGNQGGWWLHAPPEELRWYDGETLDPVPAPVPSDAMVLSSFTSSLTVGLVRARLIESSASMSLVRGRWFSPSPMNQAPLVFGQGPVRVGSITGTTLPFGPPPQSWADVPNTAERRMLVNAYIESSVVLTDSGAPKPSRLPYAVLLPWLFNRHPRMSESKRQALWSGLTTSLAEGGLATGALERAVVSEFGTVMWDDHHITTGVIDTRNMKTTAVLAILEHLRDVETLPFVVDWGGGDQDMQRLLDVFSHPGCLAVVTRSMVEGRPTSEACWLTSHPEFGVLSVNISGLRFTIRLRPVESGHLRPPRFPVSAMELQHAVSGNELNVDEFSGAWPKEHRSLLEQALFAHPQGDERLASRLEHRSPLAAWIASPSEERAHRALRMASLLPEGWLELLPVDDVPVHMMPDVFDFAGKDWQSRAILRYATASHHDPSLLEHLAAMIQTDTPNVSAALLFLCTAQHHVPELASMFEKASRIWWDKPTHVTSVLETVFNGQGDYKGIAEVQDWVSKSQHQPANSDLGQWGQILTTLQKGEPFQSSTQRIWMERFPFTWWMGFAHQWLVTQLASASGRMWLAQHPLPWVAILARTPGERCGVPGHTMHHPGLSLAASDLLPIRLLPDGPGVPALNDLLTMVNAHEQLQPVPRLQTHSDGGWLARPVSNWPMFTQDVHSKGCPSIALLLLGRQYAARFNQER